MMKEEYIIFSFETLKEPDDIMSAGGWFKDSYESLVYEDIAEPIAYFDSKESAYKAWEKSYSETMFEYDPDREEWLITVYALCQRVQEDETDVLEVSDGWLTVSEVLEAGR